MRKLLPFALAAVTFLLVFAALSPTGQTEVPVAAVDLPAGRTLTAEDITTRAFPADLIPPEAITQTAALVGQALAVPRSAGDFFTGRQFGAPIGLASDERALAVRVDDATGLAGLLRPGQRVGVAAVLFDAARTAAYTKITLGGLRVLYLPPNFRASEPDPQAEASLGATSTNRLQEAVIVLAVPTTLQTVQYDPPPNADPATLPGPLTVSPLELLAALNASDNAALSLFLEPEQPASFTTSGLYLPDLDRRPVPTPQGNRP